MDQNIVFKAVEAWQKNDMVHQLTCGNDSNHPALIPIMSDEGKCILHCSECGYEQHFIPEIVIEAYEHSK